MYGGAALYQVNIGERLKLTDCLIIEAVVLNNLMSTLQHPGEAAGQTVGATYNSALLSLNTDIASTADRQAAHVQEQASSACAWCQRHPRPERGVHQPRPSGSLLGRSTSRAWASARKIGRVE